MLIKPASNNQNIVQTIELNGISVDREIILHILSFLPSYFTSTLILVSKSWKQLIYEQVKIDYFSSYYDARRWKSGVKITDSTLNAQLPFYAYTAPFTAMLSICKASIRRIPDAHDAFTNRSHTQGSSRFASSCKLSNELFAVTSGKEIFSIISPNSSENFNLATLLGINAPREAPAEKEPSDIPTGTKRKCKGVPVFAAKRRKLHEISIRELKPLSETKVLIESECEGLRTLYVFDIESKKIIDFIGLWGDWQVKGSLVMLLNEPESKEHHKYSIELYEFDEAKEKFVLLNDDLCKSRGYDEGGKYTTTERVFLNSSVPAFNNDPLIHASLLDDAHVALFFGYQNKTIYLFVHSTQTCEMNCIIQNCKDENKDLFENVKIANHHVVFVYKVSETKISVEDGEEWEETMDPTQKIVIHNLLTGRQNSFSPQDFLPYQDASITDFKIREHNNIHYVIVQAQASQGTAYFAIPLGHKFEIGLKDIKV